MSPQDETSVEFRCDGRTIRAKKCQSVAAALWAHGDRVLSRSTKYHRPRGWACGTGDCANCTMRVGGVPNVRTCVRPVEPGLEVESQNAWPNARQDIFRANDYVFRGGIDHHHGFVRPRFLYPLFGRVIRTFAGWGRVPRQDPEKAAPEPASETRVVDLVVAGAGPAGLAAATAAAEAGAQVLLVERGSTGGTVAWLKRKIPDPDTDKGTPVPGEELAARWREEARATGRVVLLEQAVHSGLYPGHIHMVRQPDRILLVRSRATVVTTGGLANEGLFEGNDLPGVMSAKGALALLNREGVRPGQTAVVLGAGAHGLVAALELHEAGVHVRRVVEPAEEAPGPRNLLQEVEQKGIPVDRATHVARAHGFNRLRKLTLQDEAGKKSRVKADLLVIALGSKTLPLSFQGLGATLTHDPRRGGTIPVLDERLMTSVDGLHAAGDAAGIGTIATARASGRLAGMQAAKRLGYTHHALEEETPRLVLRLQESGMLTGPAGNEADKEATPVPPPGPYREEVMR